MVSVNIIGVEQIQTRFGNMVNNSKIEQALDKGAALVEHDAKRLVRVDTGRLKNSINTNKTPLKRNIGSSLTYAAAQEFGRSDMPNYGYTPYLRPALRKNRTKIRQYIREALKK